MSKINLRSGAPRPGAFRSGATVSALWASSLAIVGACAFSAPAAVAAMDATVPHSYLVFFDFNKSNLTPQAVAIVDQAAKDAAAGKATQIEVTGYTDTVGSDAYNMRLSKRRALSVEAELTKQGLSADEISIFAKGKHDLLVPTADGVKEPQNRRVSIIYSTPAAPAEAMAEKPAEAPAAPADAGPPEFAIWAQLEGGITANPDQPHSGVNFGHLFTDKTNQLVLNQLLVTAEKPLDPKATDYAVGYRLQALFGTDARYTHYLGEFNHVTQDRTQVALNEAWITVHTPWLTDNGVDIKAGQFVTYLGAETIDPSGNYLYSKSYIFNFGIPLVSTGFMTITHVSDTLDLYIGADTGVNTTAGDGDENTGFAFQGGFGLNNLMDGNLTVLAQTHIGPENPGDSSNLRYLNDILFTYKASDSLTLLTELNFIKDDKYHAIGYGAAEYFTYTVSDELAVVGRGEVWRDNSGFFVAGFPGNNDFVNVERGYPTQKPVLGGGATTYGEITLGLNIKPAMPGPIQALTIRPEIRLDGSLNDTTPFDDGTKDTQFTFGLDFILKI